MTTIQVFSPGTTFGTLTINSLSMHTFAWRVQDIRPLVSPAAFRGNNVIIPGASGQRAYPWRVDQADHTLDMLITGDCDASGTANVNVATGFYANWGTLRTSLLTPPVAPTATLAATIVLPDATTVAADVQVLGLELRNHTPHVDFAQLKLRIPAGYFS